jgi:hypothetical protein
MRNLVIAIGFVFVLGGCSGGATVTGKVTLDDGAAAPRGTVTYTSSAGSFHGGIGADGAYTIEAVPAGNYTVAVTGVMDSETEAFAMNYDDKGNYVEDTAAAAPKSLIAEKYSDPTKSGLTVTVPGNYDLKLEGAGGGGASAAPAAGAADGGTTDASS